MKGVIRIGKQAKLNLEPFEILDRVDIVAYRLALAPELSTIHLMLHVSMLWKYLPDLSHVLTLHTI